MEETLEKNIENIKNSASKLVSQGWAESFFGNISILMDPFEEDPDIIERFISPVEVPELNGLDLLVTRTTSTMEEVASSPDDSIGLYRINGEHLELIWGAGPPTSELSSHLMAYAIGKGQAIIHCHMEDVRRVASVIKSDPPLPQGCSMVGEMEPGSMELAEATMDVLHGHDTVIWKGHGALSMTEDLESCLARLIALEAYLKDLPDIFP